MNTRPAPRAPARSGTVMVIVLGLITIMLGLALGLTARVYIGAKGGVSVQQNAQAWIMMQAARMAIGRGVAIPDAGVTGGDLPAAIPGKELSDRLGWVRIRPIGPPGPHTGYDVIASGGASAQGGTKAGANDGDPVRNAMEVRYRYVLSLPPVSATLQPAQADHYADRW